MQSAQREPTSRLFTAISLSEPVRSSVYAVAETLADEIEGVRWVRRENLHVTLRFLGEFPDSRVAEYLSWMREAAAHLPLRLSVGGVGGFPSSGSARVIWVGARDDTGEIEKVYNVLDKGAEKCGLKREGRKYRPHITVGRAGRRPMDIPASAIERFRDEYIELEVSDIVLYRSVLDRAGAIYTVIERIGPLA